MDPEREALEMIYRNHVEFAVGHGVAVHAEPADNTELATEIRTTVMPQYEVQRTETPALIHQIVRRCKKWSKVVYLTCRNWPLWRWNH